MLTRRHLMAASAASLAAGASGARAQADWPNRPVKVIVVYPPAGGADTTARILFQKLSEMWGKSFVIDNRGGAGGTIGEAVAAKSDPDGYTLLYDATAFSVNPALYPKLSFDYGKDFEPVFLASLVPNILVVTPSVEAKTVADIIELAKKTPGGLDFASSGNGTLQHLCLELLKFMAKVPINHIPYRGGGLALNDVVAGQVKYFFSNGSSSVGLVQGGKVKAIAHTGKGRLGTLPDLPAVQDTIPGFEAYEWNGVFVPTGTSPEIVKKLNAGLNEVLRQPDIVARFKSLNIDFKAEHAGRIPRLRRRRDREVGQGGARGGDQARIGGLREHVNFEETIMSMNQSSDPLRVAAARSIREHWLLFVVEGIVLVVLGLLAVLLPPLATLGVTIFLGWLFLISGVMGLIATFWARQAPGILVVAAVRAAWHRGRSRSARQPSERRGFADPGPESSSSWSRASPRSCTRWSTASSSRAAGASCCSAG